MPRKSSERARRDARFRRALVAWFRREGRDLPWRRTRDPYRVLVSEVMLQQTQVSRVEGYWHRFLDAFPTLHDLAAAEPAMVREQWQGLGYYRRAANLHRLAQVVRDEHDGRIPDDPGALRRLPGVGAYTAGAVATFAFEKPVPAVDTNVARVLRRAFHPRSTGRAGEQRLWATAARLVPRKAADAWAFNQAIMELGALVCTARAMRCDACPVRAACSTGRKGGRAGRRTASPRRGGPCA
ncbi:MAG: A/G-specific adenine glycosylase [Gemmatimonadales bacterium]|nr:A/G-specific adenine glycosylase [Gemmatimonadales bacterium]